MVRPASAAERDRLGATRLTIPGRRDLDRRPRAWSSSGSSGVCRGSVVGGDSLVVRWAAGAVSVDWPHGRAPGSRTARQEVRRPRCRRRCRPVGHRRRDLRHCWPQRGGEDDDGRMRPRVASSGRGFGPASGSRSAAGAERRSPPVSVASCRTRTCRSGCGCVRPSDSSPTTAFRGTRWRSGDSTCSGTSRSARCQAASGSVCSSPWRSSTSLRSCSSTSSRRAWIQWRVESCGTS